MKYLCLQDRRSLPKEAENINYQNVVVQFGSILANDFTNALKHEYSVFAESEVSNTAKNTDQQTFRERSCECSHKQEFLAFAQTAQNDRPAYSALMLTESKYIASVEHN